ncbi:uncharacterized protein LOC143287223 [Babylonia areolata]|uniref:uncharacterized protein LOC143287223 n=1 Tax=Babylonia areolata TaxID=304850 RepID=UPI003FD31781
MDEQHLIAAVAAHRSLYDPTHNKYKDVELRNALWQQIAEDLKTEVEVCKAKWRTLRDGFTRALRQQREARTVFPSKVKKPWRYQMEMEFLIPFIYSRESRINNPDLGTEEEDQDLPAKASPPADDCESDVMKDNDDTQSVSSNTLPEPPILLPVTLMNASQNSAGLKRHFEAVDSEEMFEYLHCKKQEMEELLKEKKLESPKSAHCQCRCPTDDPTEAFFFSMGQSVKRLPFYLQAQVKMKVCQVVTEAEMECLDSASVQ